MVGVVFQLIHTVTAVVKRRILHRTMHCMLPAQAHMELMPISDHRLTHTMLKKSLRMLGMDSSLENCRIAFLPSLTLPLQPKSLLTSEPGIGKVIHFCNYIDIWQMSGVYSYTSIHAQVVPLWLFIMLVCQAGSIDQPSLSIQGSERSSRCYYS